MQRTLCRFVFTATVLTILLVGFVGCASQVQTSSEQTSSQEASSTSSSTATASVAHIKDNTSSNSPSKSNSSAKNGPTAVAVGETFSTDNYEITLTSVEWVDEIYPPDTSGYYRYYQNEENNTYLLVKGYYKNLWTDFTEPHWATEAKFVFNDKYNIEAQIEDIQDGKMSSSYAINPMETSEIYIWASVSDEMKDSTTTAKLIWNIPTDSLGSFYRSGTAHDTYEVAL